MIMNIDKENFQKELKALLEKYNVRIMFSVSDCSDTYGLYEEKMIIYHRNPHYTKTLIEVDGWSIGAEDL